MSSPVLCGLCALLCRSFRALLCSIIIPRIPIIRSPPHVTWLHSAQLSDRSRDITKRSLLNLNLETDFLTPCSSLTPQASYLSTTTAKRISTIRSISTRMRESRKDLSFLEPSLKGMLRLRYASNLSDLILRMLTCTALYQESPLDYEDSKSFLEVGTW